MQPSGGGLLGSDRHCPLCDAISNLSFGPASVLRRGAEFGQEWPVAASESGRSTFDMRGEYRQKQFVERSPLDERLVLTRLLKSALDFLDEVLVAFKGNVVLTWLPKT